MPKGISIWLLSIAAVALCGCASKDEGRFFSGNGDAGQFILRQALARSGRPVSTNNLPKLNEPWRYFEDEHGIVVRFPRERFSELQKFLRASFGDPAQEPMETTDGKLGWYAAKDIGIAIQLGYDRKDAQVIVLRPLSSREVYERMPRQ